MATTDSTQTVEARAHTPIQNHAKTIKTSSALPGYARTAMKPARSAGRRSERPSLPGTVTSRPHNPFSDGEKSKQSLVFCKYLLKSPSGLGGTPIPRRRRRRRRHALPQRLHNAASRPAFPELDSRPPPLLAPRGRPSPSPSSLTARPKPIEGRGRGAMFTGHQARQAGEGNRA